MFETTVLLVVAATFTASDFSIFDPNREPFVGEEPGTSLVLVLASASGGDAGGVGAAADGPATFCKAAS